VLGDTTGGDSDCLALWGAPERAGFFRAEGFRLSFDPAFFRFSPIRPLTYPDGWNSPRPG
jgi:hypothetical protein